MIYIWYDYSEEILSYWQDIWQYTWVYEKYTWVYEKVYQEFCTSKSMYFNSVLATLHDIHGGFEVNNERIVWWNISQKRTNSEAIQLIDDIAKEITRRQREPYRAVFADIPECGGQKFHNKIGWPDCQNHWSYASLIHHLGMRYGRESFYTHTQECWAGNSNAHKGLSRL